MYIFLNFTEKERYENDKIIEVYANEAPIGFLYEVKSNLSTKKFLYWTPDKNRNYIDFQFRNADTFYEVVEQLNNYKYDQGYTYLGIWCRQGEYGMLDRKMLEKAGFKSLPDGHPECLYLE